MSPTADETPQKAEKKSSGQMASTVRVTHDAFRQLTAQARVLGMNNSEYASAAIAYFATNGLDPLQAGLNEGVQTRAKMGELLFELRKQNVDIGNRLVAIIRTWESNSYKFHQAQQATVLNYLESIEANILNHQMAVESQVLSPILERVVRNGVEAHISRIINEVLFLRSKDTPFSREELRTSTTDYDGQRDRQQIVEVRKLLENVSSTAPKATVKPAVSTPVVGAPVKSATPAATPPTNVPKP